MYAFALESLLLADKARDARGEAARTAREHESMPCWTSFYVRVRVCEVVRGPGA